MHIYGSFKPEIQGEDLVLISTFKKKKSETKNGLEKDQTYWMNWMDQSYWMD